MEVTTTATIIIAKVVRRAKSTTSFTRISLDYIHFCMSQKVNFARSETATRPFGVEGRDATHQPNRSIFISRLPLTRLSYSILFALSNLRRVKRHRQVRPNPSVLIRPGTKFALRDFWVKSLSIFADRLIPRRHNRWIIGSSITNLRANTTTSVSPTSRINISLPNIAFSKTLKSNKNPC